MPETKLPTKLSELLRLAVSDARKCEAMPGVKLDMGRWVVVEREPGGNETCYACMAGAVILQTLKVKPADFEENRVEPDWLGELDTENALYAIDCLRTGDLDHAGEQLELDTSAAQCSMFANIIRAELRLGADGRRATWETYLRAADYLEEQGL